LSRLFFAGFVRLQEPIFGVGMMRELATEVLHDQTPPRRPGSLVSEAVPDRSHKSVGRNQGSGSGTDLTSW
jgi:hypothetical protein